MAERTKRGDEDRKQEDKEMTKGEPVATTPKGKAGAQPANTTRDNRAKPEKGTSDGDDGTKKS